MKSAIQHNLIEISETNSSLEYISRKMDYSEYIFHFQPIVQVTAEGYKMIGAEALIRKVSNGTDYCQMLLLKSSKQVMLWQNS